MCGLKFQGGDALSWHVSTAHPIERPLLILAGAPAPADIRIRSRLEPADAVVANCTSARLSRNGQPEVELAPESLISLISSDTDAEHRIRLFNMRAEDEAKIEARYALRVTIPDSAELTEADELFVRHVAVDKPTMGDIERFAHETRELRSARYYVDALVSYAVGVLIKEGTNESGTSLPFAEFQGKLAYAIAELGLFWDRPVAVAVTACARLNLNDFIAAPGSRISVLDECHAFFARLKEESLIRFSTATDLAPGSLPLCPVDRDTHLVLQSFAALSRDADPAVRTAVEDRAVDGTLSSFDRTKLTALAAAHRIVGGDERGAVPLLRLLAHDPSFGAWSQDYLDDKLSLSDPGEI
jgi:hypothetical protein